MDNNKDNINHSIKGIEHIASCDIYPFRKDNTPKKTILKDLVCSIAIFVLFYVISTIIVAILSVVFYYIGSIPIIGAIAAFFINPTGQNPTFILYSITFYFTVACLIKIADLMFKSGDGQNRMITFRIFGVLLALFSIVNLIYNISLHAPILVNAMEIALGVFFLLISK